MGFYIQTPRNTDKANELAQLHGAEVQDGPLAFAEVPEDKALICVVTNGAFEAAALCYCEAEQVAFNDVGDPRPRT